MQAIVNLCTQAEKALSMGGYIPLVSSMSGIIRATMGAVQCKVGLIGTVVAVPAGFVAEAMGAAHMSARLYDVGMFFVYQFIHGFLNGVRGSIEFVPIIGNMTCYIYDSVRGGGQLIEYFPKATQAFASAVAA